MFTVHLAVEPETVAFAVDVSMMDTPVSVTKASTEHRMGAVSRLVDAIVTVTSKTNLPVVGMVASGASSASPLTTGF
jgi:hypothetical protein